MIQIGGSIVEKLVIADSSCDLRSEPEKLEVVPLTIKVGDQDFIDDDNLDLNKMLEALNTYSGKTSTSCPSVQSWVDEFNKADECFAVTMTSALSGTYNSARVASEMCIQKDPKKKITIFDTLSTGPEMALIIEKIQELIKNNISFNKIGEIINEYLKKTHLLFTLKSLHNLAANGRVNNIIADVFDLLNMRMIAIASPEGTIKPLFKCRGSKNALSKMIDYLKKEGYVGGKIRISYVVDSEDSDKLKQEILTEWPNADIVTRPTTGLCSYYAEKGGILVGFESA